MNFGTKTKILGGVAIGGVVTSLVLAVKGTPNAKKALDIRKAKLKLNPDSETRFEIESQCAKDILVNLGPAILSAAGACGCIYYLATGSLSMNKALIASFMATQTDAVAELNKGFKDFKGDPVKPMDKEDDDEEEINVYEPFTDTTFTTKRSLIRKSLKKANTKLQNDYEVRLGWLINQMGGSPYSKGLKCISDYIGWSTKNEAQTKVWNDAQCAYIGLSLLEAFDGEKEEPTYIIQYEVDPVQL